MIQYYSVKQKHIRESRKVTVENIPEYILIKGHIVTYTLKRHYFLVPFSFLVLLLFLNNIIALLTQSHQAAYLQSKPALLLYGLIRVVYVNHIHLYNWSHPSCYLTTAILNDFNGVVMAYIALGYSYWASFHNMYAMPTKDINYNCHIKAIELI